MEKKNYEEVLETLKAAEHELENKMKSKLFVVAAYGGYNLYSYVGAGNGYRGSVLVPFAHNPHEFDYDQAKTWIRNAGTFYNGYLDTIVPRPWPAADYYKEVLQQVRSTILIVENYMTR